MNEKQLLDMWGRARLHIIVSQLAPTFLLTVVIAVLSLAADASGSTPTKIAAAGILLASGILGSVAQFTAASEAQAIAEHMRSLEDPSPVVKQIVRTVWWTFIVKYITPAIFTVIFAAILWQLFL